MSSIQLFIAIIALFSIFFYFRYPLYIIWVRLFYGIYNYRYIYLLNNDSYYQSAYYVKGELSNQISCCKSAIKNPKKCITDQPLYFQNIKYGITTKDLVKILGKPTSFDLIEMNDIKVVSMEYNIQENNVVDKYIYYFHNDTYYLGEFVFNKVGNETSEEILNSLNKKYHTRFSNINEFSLKNENNNYLSYHDLGFRITVSYFNAKNSVIIDLIAQQIKKAAVSRSYYDYQLNVNELSF